jgi:transcriptional regulator with XRE-family HTH domain
MGMSQNALAEELGTRQQTVSEWETGRYQPRGTSARLLSIIAERAGFEYEPGSRVDTKPDEGKRGRSEIGKKGVRNTRARRAGRG